MGQRPLRLGRARSARGGAGAVAGDFDLPAHHLVTHAVCVGMTGSGKTGLAITMLEEALRSRVPAVVLDVKGDLANLALLFDPLDESSFLPWVDVDAARRDGRAPEAVAAELASSWRDGLGSWGLGADDVKALRDQIALRIITPGTSGGGESLHVLSPLEPHGDLWEVDEEAARQSLGAALSLLLRMIERDADPTRGREHVLLAHLAERRLRAGKSAGLEALLADLKEPPIERVGAMALDEFFSPRERADLMRDLNALVASPTFATWRQGAPLDVAAWMRGAAGDSRVPVTIVSVAHLEDEERMLVLSLVLEQTLAYVRGLSGTTDLRALVLFDEIFGFLPPHPASPPTKRPMLALLKQARAFGVACVLATQNPIDLDYKALSNAGVWFIGRLQTDADRERVVEGLSGSDAGAAASSIEPSALAQIIKTLPPRTFFMRDVHARDQAPTLLETRWTLSWLRGPMTRMEIRRWRSAQTRSEAAVVASLPSENPPAITAATAPRPPIAPSMPELPAGWRAMHPCPPDAPPSSWRYAPHAALLGRVEIESSKLGYRESRPVAVLAPLDDAGLDLARASAFSPEDFRHAAVPGALYAPLGEAFTGARATRAIEKALRERALDLSRATVFQSVELEAVSRVGETREAFAARCQQEALRAYGEEHQAILAKHDPRIQRLATNRDAAQDALRALGPAFPGSKDNARRERARARLDEAEASLAEAVAKRNLAVRARETELRAAAAEIVAKELKAKPTALLVETYAIAWLPS